MRAGGSGSAHGAGPGCLAAGRGGAFSVRHAGRRGTRGGNQRGVRGKPISLVPSPLAWVLVLPRPAAAPASARRRHAPASRATCSAARRGGHLLPTARCQARAGAAGRPPPPSTPRPGAQAPVSLVRRALTKHRRLRSALLHGQVVKKLGKGVQGVTWLVRHMKENKVRALKRPGATRLRGRGSVRPGGPRRH